MNIISFVEKINRGISLGLPGKAAHKYMSPAGRYLSPINSSKTKESAVLILVSFNNNEPSLTLIERAKYNGIHSGQIAFPGGKFDCQFDKSLVDTAIRETYEEVGYKTEYWQIIAQLSDLYIPVSDIFVHPFLAVTPKIPTLHTASHEVAQIFQTPLLDFNKNNIFNGEFLTQEQVIKAPYWKIGNFHIWGATAMIISELIFLLKQSNDKQPPNIRLVD